MWEKFLTTNTPTMKLARTIAQGVIGVVIGIITVYAATLPEWFSVIVAPLVMAILSPIMAEIGNSLKEEDHKVGGTE